MVKTICVELNFSIICSGAALIETDDGEQCVFFDAHKKPLRIAVWQKGLHSKLAQAKKVAVYYEQLIKDAIIAQNIPLDKRGKHQVA